MRISDRDFLTDIPAADDLKEKLVSYRKQGEIVDGWLKIRLEKVLPMVMKREGIDTWVVCNHEHNEDPVFRTLSPWGMLSARRLTILVFHLNEDGTVSRYSLTHPVPDIGSYYTAAWLNPKGQAWGHDRNLPKNVNGVKVSEVPETQMECLGRFVHELHPTRIGLDYSTVTAYGDGLSYSLYQEIMKVLPEEDRTKVVSAAPLCVGWLETRIDEELDAYTGIVQIAHALIKEAFSSRVVHPGVTTQDDVRFWMMQKSVDMGLSPWFEYDCEITREGFGELSGEHVILPGDLLHCDIGFRYLGLCTDTQEMAYVLKNDETDAPKELKDAMAATNRLQEITLNEFAAGRTGNEILASARARAEAQGLEPCIYCHPLGFDGHAAGPTIGLWDMQDGVPGEGDYVMHDHTCYSLELNAAVPLWGQKVPFSMETDVMLRDGKKYYMAGRQTQFHLIG